MMDKNTVKILLLTSLLTVSASFVAAQDRHGGRMSFEELDVDRSGEITSEDLTALRNNRFADLDANSDGNISKEEFIASQQRDSEERANRMFDRLDADGDGLLGRDVIESQRRGNGSERMISRFDADNSGGISAEEFEEARAKVGKRMKGGNRDGKRRN